MNLKKLDEDIKKLKQLKNQLYLFEQSLKQKYDIHNMPQIEAELNNLKFEAEND